jgi:hypothetical protein
MKGDETPAVRETYQQYMTFLAGRLQPRDVKTGALGKPYEESSCALLGFLTGFLSHYAVLAPLANLTRDKSRLETTLTEACTAFWRQ